MVKVVFVLLLIVKALHTRDFSRELNAHTK